MPKAPPAPTNSRAGKVPSPRLASVTGQRPATAPVLANAAEFVVRRMGRVNEAPALIDAGVFQQPLHRTPSRPRHAIFDFLDLLGGMNMHRAAVRERNDSREFVRRHSTQAVRRDADIGARQFADRLARSGHQRGELIDRADEAALSRMRRSAAEAAMRIKTRQQREANAGILGRLRDPRGHLGEIGVGRAITIVVQIVEFADVGKTLLEHLDIKQRCDSRDVVRRHRERKTIHRLTPGPERIRAVTAQFRQPRHAALECVAVQACKSWKRYTVAFVAGGWRHIRRHSSDRAGGDDHLHVSGPARGQERGGEMQSCHVYTPAGQNHATIICLDI